MPTVTPFDEHADRYDAWFDDNEAAYESELAAIAETLPSVEPDRALEVGVGSGRFAAPLGVGVGVDPAAAMLERAAARGVEPVMGVAEALPIRDRSVDLVVFVTTVCFVDDLDRTLRDAARVLRPGGTVSIGFVDEESPLGQRYLETTESNPFYEEASFVSVAELETSMTAAGFEDLEARQTLFSPPSALQEPDRVEPGWGEGSFVVLSGRKPR